MKTIDYKKYVESQTKNSFLRKCFISYLNKDFSFIDINNEIPKQDKRNYKTVAGIGYISDVSNEFKDDFKHGIDWIIGREYSNNDSVFYDETAILGLLVGLKNYNYTANYKEWFEDFLNKKSNLSKSEQLTYSMFFKRFLNDSINEIGDTELGIELSIFLQLRKGETKSYNSRISDYLISLKRKSFPYYNEDDFFRNLISNSNVEQITKQYILDQEKYRSEILKSKNEVKKQFKLILNNDAKRYAKTTLGLIFLLILISYWTCFRVIYWGDWDFWEPKTFLFWGTPILGYLVYVAYFLIQEKELNFSPMKLFEVLKKIKYEELVKKFNLENKTIA